MKYAIISDIHGNAPALRLALADAQAQGAEGYLLAGDYCISAPWASEVVGILRRLPNAHIVRGNDEAHMDVAPGNDGQFEVARWCASSLSPSDKAWLDALPEELSLTCEGVTIRMAHTSQTFVGNSLHEKFRTTALPELYPDKPVSREQLQADFRALWEKDTFRQHIHELPKGVYIFGHNHIQAWGEFEGRVLVNPGSCGLPLDGCKPFGAVYSLLTIDDGHITVEERRIPYNVEALIAQARGTEQYAAARVWTELIASEWRTMREKVCFFLRFCEDYAIRINDERRPFAKPTWEAAFREWQETASERFPELFV